MGAAPPDRRARRLNAGRDPASPAPDGLWSTVAAVVAAVVVVTIAVVTVAMAMALAVVVMAVVALDALMLTPDVVGRIVAAVTSLRHARRGQRGDGGE